MKLSFLLIFPILGLVSLSIARSHPISQGTLEVEVQSQRIVLHLETPLEGLAVAKGQTVEAVSRNSASLKAEHGIYLLSHFSVLADGATLRGDMLPPLQGAASKAAQSDWLTYEFSFPVAQSVRPVQRLVIAQDVLAGLKDPQGVPWTASYLATVHFPDGKKEMHLLSREQKLEIRLPGVSSPAASHPTSSITLDYVKHGIWHILTGYDHMLFMAALVLAATSFGDLVKVVTAFTVAHTFTLTLSVLHIFRMSTSIVEPMIAASIVFVAVQNIVAPQASQGWSRLALAFGFGLFHGLGFAGGLLEAMRGLSEGTVATAILAFSLGVELGHQCVVLPLFAALQIGKKIRLLPSAQVSFSALAIRYGSLVIAVAGSYYLVMALRG